VLIRKYPWVLAVVAVLAMAAAASDAAQRQSGTENAEKETVDSQAYIRLQTEEKSPHSLQVAVVRCVPKDPAAKPVTVDLVSAIHVGEKSYYEQLNREFRNYDSVLYELVAPEGARIPQGGPQENRSHVSTVQGGLKDLLELSFQLEEIDYTVDNMVHADMSPEQFAKTMQRRGESFLGMFLRMMGYSMAKQQGGQSSDMELLAAMFSQNRALALKRVMAEQFTDMEGSLLAINGADGSTIISERNKVALDVLRKQLDAGKQKLAIFYGAGHMPDMLKRLQDDFGLRADKTRWLVAWDLRDEKEKK